MPTVSVAFKSREGHRKQIELEEGARKAGLVPAEVDEDGKEINPHILTVYVICAVVSQFRETEFKTSQEMEEWSQLHKVVIWKRCKDFSNGKIQEGGMSKDGCRR